MKQFWGPEGRVGKGQWGRTGLGNLDPFAALLTGRDVREQSSASGSGKGCQGWERMDVFHPGSMWQGLSLISTNKSRQYLGSKRAGEGPAFRKRLQQSPVCPGKDQLPLLWFLLGKSFHLSLSPLPSLLGSPTNLAAKLPGITKFADISHYRSFVHSFNRKRQKGVVLGLWLSSAWLLSAGQ